jgi:hypothetical protein
LSEGLEQQSLKPHPEQPPVQVPLSPPVQPQLILPFFRSRTTERKAKNTAAATAARIMIVAAMINTPINRVGGEIDISPSSHTTVRTVRYTAVQPT